MFVLPQWPRVLLESPDPPRYHAVMGLASERGYATKGFRYDLRARQLEWYELPADVDTVLEGAQLAPDAKYLGYVARRGGRLYAATVVCWPSRTALVQSRWVPGYISPWGIRAGV